MASASVRSKAVVMLFVVAPNVCEGLVLGHWFGLQHARS